MRTVSILAICFCMAACEKPTRELELIMPVQELDRVVAEQIVALVEKDSEESGLEITLISPPDSGSALDALEAGYGDLAFAPNNKRYRDGISTVIPLYPSVLHIAARKNDVPDTLRELLIDATVYAGTAGSITRVLAEEIAGELGIDSGATRFVDTLDADTDVLMVYAPIDRDRIVGAPDLNGFRLFSLGHPADVGAGSAVDRAVLLNPRLRPFIIPVGTYDELTPEPIVTLAVDNLLVAREDLDDAVAYDVFAEILRLRPALFGERPELFQPLDDQVASSNWAFSMHPGAIAFLQRDEPTLVERYSGVAEVLVTLLVGVVSGSIAVLKIYRIRRKNRIDRFYTDVIAIRDSVSDKSSDADRATAIEKIRELQNQGFDMLVHEKLAADESFRIFIELTNDSIETLKQAP